MIQSSLNERLWVLRRCADSYDSLGKLLARVELSRRPVMEGPKASDRWSVSAGALKTMEEAAVTGLLKGASGS